MHILSENTLQLPPSFQSLSIVSVFVLVTSCDNDEVYSFTGGRIHSSKVVGEEQIGGIQLQALEFVSASPNASTEC